MSFHSWLATSFVRHYPQTPAQPNAPLTLDAAFNEHVSFQVAMRLEDAERHLVRVTAEGPTGWSVRVRRVATPRSAGSRASELMAARCRRLVSAARRAVRRSYERHPSALRVPSVVSVPPW